MSAFSPRLSMRERWEAKRGTGVVKRVEKSGGVGQVSEVTGRRVVLDSPEKPIRKPSGFGAGSRRTEGETGGDGAKPLSHGVSRLGLAGKRPRGLVNSLTVAEEKDGVVEEKDAKARSVPILMILYSPSTLDPPTHVCALGPNTHAATHHHLLPIRWTHVMRWLLQ